MECASGGGARTIRVYGGRPYLDRHGRWLHLNEQKLAKLDQYGWVSRKDELIQIPISEAMKAVVAGKRPPTDDLLVARGNRSECGSLREGAHRPKTPRLDT